MNRDDAFATAQRLAEAVGIQLGKCLNESVSDSTTLWDFWFADPKIPVMCWRCSHYGGKYVIANMPRECPSFS
jgi:hypothetical protein